VDDRYVNLSHNFYHKPQLELHYRYDLNPVSSISATGFYSKGRGAGSSINSSGTMFAVSSSGVVTDRLGADGTISDPTQARFYLANAYQRISYSFHQQGGILASFDTKPFEALRVTAGGEFRMWKADHPGHFTNLFGKSTVTAAYSRKDTAGRVMSSTFSRNVYQGDLDGPVSDLGNIFAWNLAGANDPTYRTQYRNYVGETPQYTLFAQGNLQIDKLNIMGSLQYVWYKYKLTENMPSESAIGRMLTRAEEAARGVLAEGPNGSGKFLMKDNAATNARWYEFDLVNATRSRGFLQPKFGANYNVNENLNVFANFAHVERFTDLSVYYNSGLVNPDAEDEKSDQFEAGIGWASEQVRAKVNAYTMDWKNKSARIQDVSKAGEPGYDRNGFRSELVGTSRHQGIEAEVTVPFEWLGLKGLEFSAAYTVMKNTWTNVLASVVNNPNGTPRAFNTGSLNERGQVDTLFFSELKNTPVASGPQTMLSLALNYNGDGFFTGVTVNHLARQFVLDGGSYMATDGGFWYDAAANGGTGATKFDSRYSNTLPTSWVASFNVGTRFTVSGVHTTASVQVINLLDTQFLVDGDRNGVIPGPTRALRFNLSASL
jgi:hypothetical protein